MKKGKRVNARPDPVLLASIKHRCPPESLCPLRLDHALGLKLIQPLPQLVRGEVVLSAGRLSHEEDFLAAQMGGEEDCSQGAAGHIATGSTDYPSTSRIRPLLPAKDSTEMPACFNMVNCKFARGIDWSKR